MWRIEHARLAEGGERTWLHLGSGQPERLSRVWGGLSWPGAKASGCFLVLAQYLGGNVRVLSTFYSREWRDLAERMAADCHRHHVSRVYHHEDAMGQAFRARANRHVRVEGLRARDALGGVETIPFSPAPFGDRPEFGVYVARDWLKKEKFKAEAGLKDLKEELKRASEMNLEEAAKAWSELPGWQALCHCLGAVDAYPVAPAGGSGGAAEVWVGDERTGF